MSDVPDLLQQAYAHHQAGRFAEAEAGYRAVLTRDPDEPDALHLLGLLARRVGRNSQAVALIERSVARRPTFVDAVFNLGNAYQSADRLEDAEATYRRTIALKPDHDWAHLHLGNVLYKLKRFDEAQAECDLAREHRLTMLLQRRLAERRRAPRPAPRPDARNLVIGFAVGYDKHQLAPFVLSLKETGFAGDIVLFVSETPPDTIAWLAAQGVQVEPVELFRYIAFHLAHARFFAIEQFLSRFEPPWPGAGRYQAVFMADVRDVVFQSDPFAALAGRDLVCFLESRSSSLGRCDSNSVWIRNMFGEKTLADLHDQPISCVGTVLGSFDGTLDYLLLMEILSFQVPPSMRNMHGIDQGIHNIIIHRKAMPTLTVSENCEIVGTVGYGLDGAAIDDRGRLCDAHGAVIPVIHQYDRQPEYAQLFGSRWRP